MRLAESLGCNSWTSVVLLVNLVQYALLHKGMGRRKADLVTQSRGNDIHTFIWGLYLMFMMKMYVV